MFRALVIISVVTLAAPQALTSQIVARSQDLATLERTADLLRVPARLSVADVPLAKALHQLAFSSGVPLAFSASVLPDAARVTCQCDDATVEDALASMLRGTGLRWALYRSQIVIERMRGLDPPPTSRALASFPANRTLALAAAPVQPRPEAARYASSRVTGNITGQVVNQASRQPLAAVQVSVPGTGQGGLTGANGRYLITGVPAGTHELRFQRIGFTTHSQQVTVQSGSSVEVDASLREQALALDEIVVTGTAGGTQRRAIGNVVERINVGDQLELIPVANVQELFNSRAPGLGVQATTSGVGSAGRIRIRGSSSTALRNDPIVYVDGVRIFSDRTITAHTTAVGRLNDINPEDIESIEVIKGPAAATLYGTEASAGVIQVITKRGAAGGARWDASVTLGGNWIPDVEGKLPTLYGTDADGNLISMDLLEREIAEGYGNPFQTGQIQRYNLGVSGGSDLLRYYASISHNKEEGFVSWNWDERTSARMALTASPRENLTLNLSASLLRGEMRIAPGQFHQMYWGQPRTRGSIGGSDEPRRGYRDRPYEAVRDYFFDMNLIDRTQWSLEVSHEPWSWFRNRLVFGADIAESVREQTTRQEPDAPLGFYGTSGLGARELLRDQTRFHTLDYSGTASFGLTNRWSAATSAGFQYYRKNRWMLEATDQDFASPILRTVGAGGSPRALETVIENTSVGVYFQQQIDKDQRLFLTGAVRADDNSAFGENFDAAIYPKFSATWVLHEEPFWNLDWLQEFRLRSAWGMAGQQPDAFAAERLYQPVPGPGGKAILTPLAFGNPDLGPEKGQELEVGFDVGFWGGRASLSYTRYWKTTKDAIVEREIAHSVGFPGTQLVNVGQTSNWGSETSLDLQVLTGDRARLDWQFGFATMNSRIDDLGGDTETLGRIRRARHHIRGFPLASQFEYRILSADFVSGNSGPVTNLICDGGRGLNNRLPGGNPVPCSEAHELYLGPGEPTWQGNWVQTLTLGPRWQLRTNVHAEGGYWVYSEAMGGAHTTQTSTLPSVLRDDPIFVGHLQLRREATGMYRNDFARLREVALVYSVPTALTGRFGADRASITVAGRNLAYLWTKDTHATHGGMRIYDWEMGTGGEEFGGETQAADPSMATFTVDVRISF